MSGNGLHIVLMGFMGSGKSTIGKILADELDLPFVDMDQEIVEKEAMPISEIFEVNGEDYFRKVENEIMQSLLNSKSQSIISTGGGAPCFHDGIKHINALSFSFYLKVGRETLLKRITGDKSRPLAGNRTKQELKQFIDVSLREREQYYLKANQTILAFDQPDRIVGRILKYLEKNGL